jgi:hypothetical protein
VKKIALGGLIAILVGLVLASSVPAQTADLTLSLSRDWGYGGFSGEIQGTFTMKVTGPNHLARVQFFIDRTLIGEVDQPPFKLQFVTDNYPPGLHELFAIGFTKDGMQLSSQTITASFVTASEAAKSTSRTIIPILVIVFGAMLLAAVIPMLTGRKVQHLDPGMQRQYPLGGAICPKCDRPFALHFYGLHLLGKKLDRCPYCGRWSLVGYASMEMLRAAERAELERGAGQVVKVPIEEKLKKDLDDSKYQDL